VSSQMLNERTFSSASLPADRERVAASTMSLSGTIVKAVALLAVALVTGALGWSVGDDWFSSSSGLWWLIGYFLLIGLTIAAVSNPDLALPAGLLYALLMGFWMGAVSRVYEEKYDGIVAQALLASVCAFLACLVLYLVRAVRVTPKLTRAIVTATLGICLLYLVAWILSIFGVDLYFWNNPTPVGIGQGNQGRCAGDAGVVRGLGPVLDAGLALRRDLAPAGALAKPVMAGNATERAARCPLRLAFAFQGGRWPFEGELPTHQQHGARGGDGSRCHRPWSRV
jgi:FtsH-binding integral membrane protein